MFLLGWGAGPHPEKPYLTVSRHSGGSNDRSGAWGTVLGTTAHRSLRYEYCNMLSMLQNQELPLNVPASPS